MKKMISIIIITFLLIFVSGCSIKKYDGIYEKENKDLISLKQELTDSKTNMFFYINILYEKSNSIEASCDDGYVYITSLCNEDHNLSNYVVWSCQNSKKSLNDGNYYVTILFYDNNNHILGYALIEMLYYNNEIDANLIRVVEIPKIFFNYQNVTKRQVMDRIESVKNEYLKNEEEK